MPIFNCFSFALLLTCIILDIYSFIRNFHFSELKNDLREIVRINFLKVIIAFCISFFIFFLLNFNLEISKFFSDAVNKGFLYRMNYYLFPNYNLDFWLVLMFILMIIVVNTTTYGMFLAILLIYSLCKDKDKKVIYATFKKVSTHFVFVLMYSFVWFIVTITGLYKSVPYIYFAMTGTTILLLIEKIVMAIIKVLKKA